MVWTKETALIRVCGFHFPGQFQFQVIQFTKIYILYINFKNLFLYTYDDLITLITTTTRKKEERVFFSIHIFSTTHIIVYYNTTGKGHLGLVQQLNFKLSRIGVVFTYFNAKLQSSSLL